MNSNHERKSYKHWPPVLSCFGIALFVTIPPVLWTSAGTKLSVNAQEEEAPGEGECDLTDPIHKYKLKLLGPEFNIGPASLKGAEVPTPKNLGEFIKDQKMAIVLGKALFWDMQVGSDGVQACASCHFRAGADPRSMNQLAPGGLSNSRGESDFFDLRTQAIAGPAHFSADKSEPHMTFDLKPPNSRLEAKDFPLHKIKDPTDRKSEVLSDVDDIVSSQGIIFMEFVRAVPGQSKDEGKRKPDPVFNVQGMNSRRTEPRNTPTVINSVFNHRNFWDGRAQEIYNGRNFLGVRDDKATVIKALSKTILIPVKVRIDNASLASLSMGPPLSVEEMSFEHRTFPEIGRRLVTAQPLAGQRVSPSDSVLGDHAVRHKTGDKAKLGLVTKYEDFIRAAFHEAWWKSDLYVELDETDKENIKEIFTSSPSKSRKHYRLIEYNFSLFFGLALQSYMATLISDDAEIDQHFDRLAQGKGGLLDEIELRGLEVFKSEKARCADCHNGPEFSGVAFRTTKRGFLNPDHPDIAPPFAHWQPPEEIERMVIGSCEVAVYDQGFYNLGVRPFTDDFGLGRNDEKGFPLAAAKVLANKSKITNRELRELEVARLSTIMAPSLASTKEHIWPVPEIQEGERTSVNGTFKIPSLRNVELTAPYFHTGGYLTLRQVVEFYNRGGDFHDWVSPDGIPQDRFMDLGIGKLNLSEDEIESLVAFLKTLTDQRVVKQSAPFDHPQLFVPHGHIVGSKDGQPVLEDIIVEVPEVGAAGGPLPKGFLEF